MDNFLWQHTDEEAVLPGTDLYQPRSQVNTTQPRSQEAPAAAADTSVTQPPPPPTPPLYPASDTECGAAQRGSLLKHDNELPDTNQTHKNISLLKDRASVTSTNGCENVDAENAGATPTVQFNTVGKHDTHEFPLEYSDVTPTEGTIGASDQQSLRLQSTASDHTEAGADATGGVEGSIIYVTKHSRDPVRATDQRGVSESACEALQASRAPRPPTEVASELVGDWLSALPPAAAAAEQTMPTLLPSRKPQQRSILRTRDGNGV